ncbi:MAG: hypothetical protein K2Q01_05045, partial [Rickettsiales bacterium]|nr:hypothetical protein [Rickettsiales bacterium]
HAPGLKAKGCVAGAEGAACGRGVGVAALLPLAFVSICGLETDGATVVLGTRVSLVPGVVVFTSGGGMVSVLVVLTGNIRLMVKVLWFYVKGFGDKSQINTITKLIYGLWLPKLTPVFHKTLTLAIVSFIN